MSRQYKQWSPSDRERGGSLYNMAKKAGIIPPPKKCNRCGQEEGILQAHCEDYNVSLYLLPDLLSGRLNKKQSIVKDSYIPLDQSRGLEPATEHAELWVIEELLKETYESLCWRCHMIHHSQHINPEACKRYWDSVKGGHVWPPVFKHDFSILARENGIVKKKATPAVIPPNRTYR